MQNYPLGNALAPPRGQRRWAAAVLQAVVVALDRLADAMQVPRVAAPAAPAGAVEFHCEAGAPEGALYVDGRFVGWIDGVQRL